MRLSVLFNEVRGCRVCASALPLGPRPLVQGSAQSKLLIIGQAPGAAAHRAGRPWLDRSGDRLRAWLGLTPERFYDPALVALMPMGFCYPGTGPSGDAAPRPECAPMWHDRLRRAFRGVELTVYIGRHAFDAYVGGRFASLADAVRDSLASSGPEAVLPHPSPRNNPWLKAHPWFETDALPTLRARVASL